MAMVKQIGFQAPLTDNHTVGPGYQWLVSWHLKPPLLILALYNLFYIFIILLATYLQDGQKDAKKKNEKLSKLVCVCV